MGPAAIIEFSFHTGVVANLVRTVGRAAGSSFHLRWRTKADWRDEIPVGPQAIRPFISDATHSAALASFAFYGGVFRRAPRSRVLWVSTGPESNILADLLFFLILCLFWRRKMVLSVRNSDRWGCARGAPSFQDRVRSWVILRIPMLVFESNVQRMFFHECVPSFEGRSSSLPVLFSDAIEIWGRDLANPRRRVTQEAGSLTIGLLGGVDPKRRDYETLLTALMLLEPANRRALTIAILGTSKGVDSAGILARLAAVVAVNQFSPYLSNRRLFSEMKRCDLLLSPLSTDVGYGVRKGTGAIGDALVVNLRLVIPGGIELDPEFSPASARYDTATELSVILGGYLSAPKTVEVDPSVYSHYSAQNSFTRCLRELALPIGSPRRGGRE